ncbi:MAG TPA: hypothetical protein VN452_07130 [Longilinea sp.]|nr:hypothetical protein [Longilinea sp.]
MVCPHCGFENEIGRETCSNCGESLAILEAPETQEQPVRNSIWAWVVAGLMVALVAAALIIFKGGAGAGRANPLLYAVLGDQVIPFSQMGVLENGGTKATPFSSTATNFAIAPYSIRAGHSYLSSTGQLAIFANADLNGGGQLMLADLKGNGISTASEAPLPLTVAGNFQSFSPDGKYFGYTSVSADGSGLRAVVINSRAATVQVGENMILSEILPDSNHYLAYSLDGPTGNPTALVSVAIPSGEQKILYQTTGTDTLAGVDVVSPDKSIYFVLQQGEAVTIYHMGLDGSDPEPVYTFKQPISFFGVISIAPDQKSLLVLDPNEAGTGYNFLSINPADMAVTQLASNVYAEFFSEAVFLRQMYGEMAITFSPDGKHFAYMTNSESGLSLYVSDLSGQPGTLIASGQTSFSFAFTPNSDKLIYVQYATSGQAAGPLFSSDFSGATTQLDGDVTSFNFQNGKLVYFSAPTADQTTSTLYQSELDGQGKTELLAAQPGYWVFVKLPE